MAEFDKEKWAKIALDVQDACNMSGLAHSFSAMMREMCQADMDTGARNRHSATVLFCNKISDLASAEAGFSAAYDDCLRMAGRVAGGGDEDT